MKSIFFSYYRDFPIPAIPWVFQYRAGRGAEDRVLYATIQKQYRIGVSEDTYLQERLIPATLYFFFHLSICQIPQAVEKPGMKLIG